PGRKRVFLSAPYIALANWSRRPLRSPIVVPSSTIRPSTWKNSELCDASIASYRQQRADRRLHAAHRVDLTRRRMGPQQVALDVDVERVPQVAGGVVGRDVEH